VLSFCGSCLRDLSISTAGCGEHRTPRVNWRLHVLAIMSASPSQRRSIHCKNAAHWRLTELPVCLSVCLSGGRSRVTDLLAAQLRQLGTTQTHWPNRRKQFHFVRKYMGYVRAVAEKNARSCFCNRVFGWRHSLHWGNSATFLRVLVTNVGCLREAKILS